MKYEKYFTYTNLGTFFQSKLYSFTSQIERTIRLDVVEMVEKKLFTLARLGFFSKKKYDNVSARKENNFFYKVE